MENKVEGPGSIVFNILALHMTLDLLLEQREGKKKGKEGGRREGEEGTEGKEDMERG